MKKNIIITCMILFAMQAYSQENIITLSSGYSFANVEDSEAKGTGWRINGLYEFNPTGGMFAHGITLGYLHLSSTDGIGLQETVSTINSIPVYYAPKVMFGGNKLKGFVKGAIGTQYASLKREGNVELSDFDFGFYGGGGAGIMIFIKENIFINAEYEIAWVSNAFYKDGWVNSASGGIGFKF
jgi:hypothetical protein